MAVRTYRSPFFLSLSLSLSCEALALRPLSSLSRLTQHALSLSILCVSIAGLFGFSEEVDASTLMALLDADGNQEISWQEWSHACAVWLADMSN